jgi:diacylglycerol kinase family enzyme
MTRAVLVMNNRAGTLAGRPELPGQIEDALRESGFDLRIIDEDAAPDMEGRIEAAIVAAKDLPVPLVIVGGGDGTVRGAAGRLAGTGIALGILPLGTLNILARDLGMPLDPLEAARALPSAETKRIDIGEVNGEVFTCQAVLGLPNRFARLRQANRRTPGIAARMRTILGMLRAFGRPPLSLNLVWSEKPGAAPARRHVRALALSVVNNPYEDALGSFFHRPRLDTGLLAVHRPKRFGLFWSLVMLVAMGLGLWRRTEEVEHFLTPELTIESRRPGLRVPTDGEVRLLPTPLRFRLHPRALHVLALAPVTEADGMARAEPLTA